jgi:hypothetical protein
MCKLVDRRCCQPSHDLRGVLSPSSSFCVLSSIWYGRGISLVIRYWSILPMCSFSRRSCRSWGQKTIVSIETKKHAQKFHCHRLNISSIPPMNTRNVMLGPCSGMYQSQVNLISTFDIYDVVCSDPGVFLKVEICTDQREIVKLAQGHWVQHWREGRWLRTGIALVYKRSDRRKGYLEWDLKKDQSMRKSYNGG